MKYDFYIVSSQTNNGYFSLWSWTYLMLGLTGTFLQNWNPLALYLIFTSPKTKIHVLQMIWNYWLNLGYFSLVLGGGGCGGLLYWLSFTISGSRATLLRQLLARNCTTLEEPKQSTNTKLQVQRKHPIAPNQPLGIDNWQNTSLSPPSLAEKLW